MEEQPYSKEKMDLCHNQLSQIYQSLSLTEQTKRI